MGIFDFVDPVTVRLPLPEGQFLDVKKYLTHGEEHEIFTRQLDSKSVVGETPRLNLQQVGKSKLMVYIVGWSLTKNGQPVPFSEAALDGLPGEGYAAIRDAVDQHEATMDAERMARKNGHEDKITSPEILPSVNSTAGDTNGS